MSLQTLDHSTLKIYFNAVVKFFSLTFSETERNDMNQDAEITTTSPWFRESRLGEIAKEDIEKIVLFSVIKKVYYSWVDLLR